LELLRGQGLAAGPISRLLVMFREFLDEQSGFVRIGIRRRVLLHACRPLSPGREDLPIGMRNVDYSRRLRQRGGIARSRLWLQFCRIRLIPGLPAGCGIGCRLDNARGIGAALNSFRFSERLGLGRLCLLRPRFYWRVLVIVTLLALEATGVLFFSSLFRC
jgi:hypothetical protein